MLAEDRLNAIVSMVQQAGSVTVPELAEALGVTSSTIRRDLQTLDRAHRIAKVHGGATSLERAHVTRDLTLNERSDLHNDVTEPSFPCGRIRWLCLKTPQPATERGKTCSRTVIPTPRT